MSARRIAAGSVLGIVLVSALVVPAQALADDRLAVGLFAPSAPFDGPVARLEFVSRLANHLAERIGLPAGTGRAYAKASDFAAAVKRQELQVAVVDAPYAAAVGLSYRSLGTALRAGAASSSWEIVSAIPARNVVELQGKTIAVPAIGAREESFLYDVLLEGELARGHFGRILLAPDSLSALASVEHGRADAAVVPSGLRLPPGVGRVTALGQVGWPVVMALPGAPLDLVRQVEAALASFGGDHVFGGVGPAHGSGYVALAGRFARRERRGPLAVPELRLAVEELLAGRGFTIPVEDSTSYAKSPEPWRR